MGKSETTLETLAGRLEEQECRKPGMSCKPDGSVVERGITSLAQRNGIRRDHVGVVVLGDRSSDAELALNGGRQSLGIVFIEKNKEREELQNKLDERADGKRVILTPSRKQAVALTREYVDEAFTRYPLVQVLLDLDDTLLSSCKAAQRQAQRDFAQAIRQNVQLPESRRFTKEHAAFVSRSTEYFERAGDPNRPHGADFKTLVAVQFLFEGGDPERLRKPYIEGKSKPENQHEHLHQELCTRYNQNEKLLVTHATRWLSDGLEPITLYGKRVELSPEAIIRHDPDMGIYCPLLRSQEAVHTRDGIGRGNIYLFKEMVNLVGELKSLRKGHRPAIKLATNKVFEVLKAIYRVPIRVE